MRIPDQGISRDDLFATMQSYREGDMRWRDGRTWAYVEVVKAMPPSTMLESLGPMLKDLDPAALDEAAFQNILGMAGITGVHLPERLAEINHLLDAMPPQFTEVMLLEFLNQLFQYRGDGADGA